MDPDKALDQLLDTARFVLGGEARDLFEESAENLAEQVLALDTWLRTGGFSPRSWRGRKSRPAKARASEKALRGLLQDIAEVLERQGEKWWDETVTAGTHHRSEAEKLLERGSA